MTLRMSAVVRLSVALGVALPIVMVVVGCGGGGLRGGGQTYGAAGVVKLPAGSTLQMADLKVMGCVAQVTPQSDGSFIIDEPDTGPALVAVVDRAGHMVLTGFVNASDATAAEISAKSTATALLFHQICAYTVMPSAWADALRVIAADAHTDSLADVVASRVAADPAALGSSDPAIRAALVAAAEAVLPSGMRGPAVSAAPRAAHAAQVAARVAVTRSPAAIVVTSLPTQSGIQVGANADGDGIVLTNSYRRHVWYWVYVTGYQDAGGSDHMYGENAWVKVTNAYLPATNGLAGALGSAIDALWDNVAYAPVTSDPIDITFAPSGAKKVYLSVVTAGAGSASLDLPPGLSGNPDTGDWASRKSGMQAITFVKDFMLPAFFTFIPADAVGRMTGRQLTDFSFDMISLCTQSGFDATLAISSNDWWGALQSVGKGIATDGELQQSLAKLIATRFLTKYSSAQVAGMLANSARLLQTVLKVVDYGYLGIDFVAVARDCAQSDVYNHFTVTASVPPVRIEPNPAVVHPAMSVDLTTYKGIETPGAFSYHYTTQGNYGHFVTGTQSGKDVVTSSETVTYVCDPDAKAGDTETVKVEVERRITTDAGYQMDTIGEATVTVNIRASDITMDPDAVTLNADGTADFTATVDGAVSTDARIWYHWTNTGVAGHLQPTSTYSTNEYESSSAVTHYVAGASAAEDTVTVEVLIVENGKRYPIGTASAHVTVSAQKVSVECVPSAVLNSGKAVLTASVAPPPPDTTYLVYRWTNPGVRGHLTAAGVAGQDNIETQAPSATYTSLDAVGNWQETVNVEALLRVPGQPAKSLGSATATVDIGTTTTRALRLVWEKQEPWGSGKRGVVALMFVYKKTANWTGNYRFVQHGAQLPESSGFMWWSTYRDGHTFTYGGIDPRNLTHYVTGSMRTLYEGAIGADDLCFIVEEIVAYGSGGAYTSDWQRAQQKKATWAGTAGWWFEVSPY